MKNLKNYNVIEINKTEALKVNGGDGWLYDLGAGAHRVWCGIRDGFISSFENTGAGTANAFYYGY